MAGGRRTDRGPSGSRSQGGFPGFGAGLRREKARGTSAKPTLESTLKCVRVGEADGGGDALQGALPFGKTPPRFMQAQVLDELSRRLTEDAFEGFAEVRGTDAGAPGQDGDGEVRVEIAHDPRDEIGEAFCEMMAGHGGGAVGLRGEEDEVAADGLRDVRAIVAADESEGEIEAGAETA